MRISLLFLAQFYYFADLAVLENPIGFCKLILHVVSIFAKAQLASCGTCRWYCKFAEELCKFAEALTRIHRFKIGFRKDLLSYSALTNISVKTVGKICRDRKVKFL